MRNVLKVIAALAIAAMVFVWAVSFIHPAVVEVCKTAKDGSQESCATQHVFLFVLRKIGEWLNDTNFVNMLATVVMAIFTAVLANVGRRQIRDTRVLQRAYITVEPAGVSAWLDPDDPNAKPSPLYVVGHIGIRNSGHMPARDVQWYIDTAWRIEQNLPEEIFVLDNPEAIGPIGNNVVPPGGVMNQGGPRCKFVPSGFFYVWGVVTYHDGFEAGRTTKFCHRYNARRHWEQAPAHYGIDKTYGRQYERGQGAT